MLEFLTIVVIAHAVVVLAAFASSKDEPPQPVAVGAVAFAIASAAPPVLLVVLMHIVFANASATVQFNAGSESAMRWWSFWADAWVPLMLFCVLFLIGHLIALCVTKTYRVMCITGCMTAACALVSVWARFPSV